MLVLRGEFGQGFPGQFLVRVAGHPGGRPVPLHQATLGTDHVEQVGHRVDALPDEGPFLLEPLFRLLAVGDVDRNSGDLGKGSFRVVDRKDSSFDPAHGSVRPQDPVFENVRSVLVQGPVLDRLNHRFPILRVDRLDQPGKIPVEFLDRSVPDRLKPGAQVKKPLLVAHPDGDLVELVGDRPNADGVGV